MSRWNHNICESCWNNRFKDREPIRVTNISEEEPCCFCNAMNTNGIYVREDPDRMLCGGVHNDI